MKKIITIHDLNKIDELLFFVDGIIVGSNLFATRLTSDFTLEEINLIIKKVKTSKKEIFLNVNQMLTDKQIDEFIVEFKKINYQKLDGIILADLGVLIELTKLGLNNKLIYNPETLLTNIDDFNYLSDMNIKGAYVAKEITIEEILNIGSKKKYELFMVGHGHLNMFYSKRLLLNNYNEITNLNYKFENEKQLKLLEPNRFATSFPILQDKAGTHVFRSKVMNSFNYLEKINEVVDYFVIDTIFKNDEYGLKIAKYYFNEKIELDDKLAIESEYNEIWDDGFLNNKTYYKKRG